MNIRQDAASSKAKPHSSVKVFWKQ